ncbi:hypothetical protein Tco_0365328 [Tanacetum coccineum]
MASRMEVVIGSGLPEVGRGSYLLNKRVALGLCHLGRSGIGVTYLANNQSDLPLIVQFDCFDCMLYDPGFGGYLLFLMDSIISLVASFQIVLGDTVVVEERGIDKWD